MKTSWERITAWRLDRHALIRPVPADRWLEVVSRIGGLHAQVLSAAEQALAVRVSGLPPGHLAASLWRSKSLLKTWAMRGTLHLVPAADFPELIAALSTLRHYLRPHWLKYFGVTEAQMLGLIDAMAAELSHRGMTREVLAARVAKRMRRPAMAAKLTQSWGTLLKPAAFRGHLCFGPSEGQLVTFVRPDRWLGRTWTAPDPAGSLHAVARRYLEAYGPASAADFSRWLGLDASAARRVFRELADELEEVSVGAWRGFLLARSVAALRDAEPPTSIKLLPYFDPYTVAVSPQAQYLFPARLRARVYRPQGWISPVVLVDGRIAGTWSQEKKGAVTTIRTDLFGRLPAGRRDELAEAVAGLRNLVATPVRP